MAEDNIILEIPKRLDEILKRYEGKEEYGSLDRGMFWGQELTPKKFIWSLEYETEYRSTVMIGLSYQADDQLFRVSGRVKSRTDSEPEITTTGIEEAYKILEQRIQEIPSNLKNILRQDS
ncbi:MAG: hypothetical protein HYX24_03915 [Candidatus Aenigmarchaeota archaeon]|nr:hypothetical protein [Candidatus Aenigmarchaeota archaeon]